MSPLSGDAEVCDSKVALLIEDKVFGLDVSMEYILVMNILEAVNQARDEKPYIINHSQTRSTKLNLINLAAIFLSLLVYSSEKRRCLHIW